MKLKRYRIKPGSKVDLSRFKPGETSEANKVDTEAVFTDLNARLDFKTEAVVQVGKRKFVKVVR